MIELTGRVALVTGASRGIGRATALRLAEAGADVIVNYVTSSAAANEVAEQVATLGSRAATIKADVSEPEDIASMFEFIGREFGQLDILVSNAAAGGFRSLREATVNHFEATMNTNVRVVVARAGAVSLMQHEGPARRLLRCRVTDRTALPAYGLIGASKAALESLARHLALELGNQHINVNVVLAGLVETDSTRGFPGSELAFETVAQRRVVNGLPLSPQAIADTILFLASPLSDLVQGQTLVVDGGETLHG
ncbi:MAG: SDR family oxidoreductase [Pirellulaceae bacterium]